VNHADIKKHLADYLEGQLQIDKRAVVDAHLDSCDACAREVDEMLQTIRLLRTLPEPEIPPMIAANVMRRIRSGESQLGLFARMSRSLGGALESSFVLPASAIAVAALLVSVVQNLGGIPALNGERDPRNFSSEDGQSFGQANSSIASLAPSIVGTRGGDRIRAQRAAGGANGMDFVARVERRAIQSDRMRRSGLGEAAPLSTIPSGVRIWIELEGLGLAQGSLSPLSTPQQRQPNSTSLPGPIVASRFPDQWTTNFSGGLSRNSSDLGSSGTLVMAERSGGGDFVGRSGVWSPAAVAQNEFLTSADIGGGAADQNDPRDAWLALGLEDPAGFARYIAGRNLAEQELWAARLSERAEARGLLGEFLRTLRESGDPTAVWVADDFSAQGARAQQSFGQAEE
jgi:hypothetical protein